MGLYYLQSRYYAPEVGRFINADTFISTGQGILGNNKFAYCQNNPIYFRDTHGESVLAAVFGTVAIAVCVFAISHCIASVTVLLIDSLNTSPVSFSKTASSEAEETLPPQGSVSEDPEAPPVDAGKQGKHVPGHNNHDPNKSSWPKGKNGVRQTQEAWQNGTPDPKKPDGSVRIGTASDGTVVRVHRSTKGLIHGYPIMLIGIIIEVFLLWAY